MTKHPEAFKSLAQEYEDSFKVMGSLASVPATKSDFLAVQLAEIKNKDLLADMKDSPTGFYTPFSDDDEEPHLFLMVDLVIKHSRAMG